MVFMESVDVITRLTGSNLGLHSALLDVSLNLSETAYLPKLLLLSI